MCRPRRIIGRVPLALLTGLIAVAGSLVPAAGYNRALAATAETSPPPIQAPELPPLTTQRIAEGLALPVFITSPPDDARRFIVEQGGLIRVVADGVLLPAPFLDVSALVSGDFEQGLLGLAFPPDYGSTGLFYINYTDSAGDTMIARYATSADPNVADASSAETVLAIDQPSTNHNGGHLAFGPDGYLYIGMGDGGAGGETAQRDDTLLGKMLRIDVSGGLGSGYSIPPSNPFVGPGDPLDEIWAKGLRNPYRWSFDRTTGDLYIADVGEGDWEEISFEPAGDAGGRNYGWPRMEGSHCYDPTVGCESPDLELPLYEYGHTGFRCSVTGGYVYRGSLEDLRGRYFFADFCTGEIWSFRRDPMQGAVDLVDHTAELFDGAVTGFGEDSTAELHIVMRGGGTDGLALRIVTPVMGYVLDGFGGLYPLGATPPIAPLPPNFGFDAAEDIELSGAGLYLLDAFGGVHASGVPPLTPGTPYFGFDVARDLELVGTGYYVLDGYGGVHAGGGAPPITAPTPYFGIDIARDLEVGNGGYYVLEVFGGVHAGNGAPVLNPATPYFGFDVARGLELAETGLYVLDSSGAVHAGGGAPNVEQLPPNFRRDWAHDLELAVTGFYVLDGSGAIHLGEDAIPFSSPMPHFGFDVARDLELLESAGGASAETGARVPAHGPASRAHRAPD